MHPSQHNLNSLPWPGPPYHSHDPPSIHRNPTFHHSPNYQVHPNIPPMPMPGPSLTIPPSKPFIPIGQRDLFFSKPTGGPNMSLNRAASVPPPPIPPHPYLHRSPTSLYGRPPPVPGRDASMAPPIPPKPTYPLPSRPPKIPLYPQSISEFRALETPVQILPAQNPTDLTIPNQVPPPRVPSPQIPAPRLPTPRIPSPQILPAELPLVQAPYAEPLPIATPFTQMPSIQTPSSQNISQTAQPPTERDELALMLALSAAESRKQQQLRSREDEDLAKVLEESRILAGLESLNTSQDAQQEFHNAEAGPSTEMSTLTSASASPLRAHSTPPSPPPDSRQSPAPTIVAEQVLSDEAYARALVSTEEHSEDAGSERDELDIPYDTNLPSYTEAISTANVLELPGTAVYTPAEHTADEVSVIPEHSSEPSLLRTTSVATLPPLPEPTGPSRLPSLHVTANNHLMSQPTGVDGMRVDNPRLQFQPEKKYPSGSRMSPAMPSTSLPNFGEKNVNNEKKALLTETGFATVAPAQHLDAHFLLGVSLGFMPPSMSSLATPMQGLIQNVVLPYGRCPPFHFQAPSWRHLLRLMARLRATRIEASVEAIAATRDTLKLRTVVQFVKAPDSEWRTILWLTLDHPIPPGLSALSWKYTNGDVSMLPWSYTLSDLPDLLRDGADTSTSKYYTIPSTASTPYPSLPISFPNFARYLQDVLEDSDRAMHDSSSGMRRLAKTINLCYPRVFHDDDDHSPERSGVGGLFKRVIGRGNKNKKNANEDRSDMVTPFELDEW